MGNIKYLKNLDEPKILAINNSDHRELVFNWKILSDYHKTGWKIYVITEEGIFFFLNNCCDDGCDWCKITKI